MRRKELLSRIGLAFLTFPALYFLMILVRIVALYSRGGVVASVYGDRLYFSNGTIEGMSVPYFTIIVLSVCAALFLVCMYSVVKETIVRKDASL